MAKNGDPDMSRRTAPVRVDEFDAQLLNLLQENNQFTAQELAERVNLSPASCLRRAKRLREYGVIESDVSILAADALGKRLTMIVLVTVEREQPQLLSEFRRSMMQIAEVMQCYYVTGDADFVLVVNVRDMEEYESFTNRFLFENRNVRRFQTMVVMNKVKFSTKVPVVLETNR
jgi:Lrp/AsnC family leucine-responsive transcriptional regulator